MGYWLAAGFLAIFGMPLLAVGMIIWLCEQSWEKRPGTMGSRWLLEVGLALSLPFLVLLALALLHQVWEV